MRSITYVGWDDGTSLYHYGILGQKWGVRRYQNPDGTLTEEGKSRYSRQYAHELVEAAKDVNNKRVQTKLYINAHNKTVDRLNNGGIQRFNDEWERVHGQDFGEEYFNAYSKYVSRIESDIFRDLTVAELLNNKHYIAAEKLRKKVNKKYGNNTIKQLTIHGNDTIEDIEKFLKQISK